MWKQGSQSSALPLSAEEGTCSLHIKLKHGKKSSRTVTYMSNIHQYPKPSARALTQAYEESTTRTLHLIATPCTYIQKPTKKQSGKNSNEVVTSALVRVKRWNNSSDHFNHHRSPWSRNQGNPASFELYITSLFLTHQHMKYRQLIIPSTLIYTCAPGASSTRYATPYSTFHQAPKPQSVMWWRHTK